MGRSCRKRVPARLPGFRRSSTSSARARFPGTAREHSDAVRRRRKFFCCSENCSRCRWLRFRGIHSITGVAGARRIGISGYSFVSIRVHVVKQKSHAQSRAWLISLVQQSDPRSLRRHYPHQVQGVCRRSDTLSHCGSPAVLLSSQNRTRTNEVNLTVVVRARRMCAANALRTTHSTSSGC